MSRLALLALAGLSIAAPLAAQAPARSRGLDPANLDTTCAPCADFNQFANGGWLKRSTIPAAYSRWGSFNELADKNEAVLRQIVEAAAASTIWRSTPSFLSASSLKAPQRE